MEKRYQVFVSSTYQDLQHERQEVMHALLELDCIPSGMELFPAADQNQWSLIEKVISECDYYVLILAGRYGSCDPAGVGYTEKEYLYAQSLGKPILAFLHKDPGSIPAKYSESTKEGKEKIANFRSLAEKRLCKYWSSSSELGSVVSRSLVRLIKTTPAVGWIRGDELPSKDATVELLRLRRRIEELEAELTGIRITAPKGTESLSQAEELITLRYSYEEHDELGFGSKEGKGSFERTWNELFSAIAPLMINEESDNGLRRALNSYVKRENVESLMKRREFKGKALGDFALFDEDFQTIKIQFRALGFIDKSNKTRSVHDKLTYWTLTPYGDSIMTRLRAIKTTRGQQDD